MQNYKWNLKQCRSDLFLHCLRRYICPWTYIFTKTESLMRLTPEQGSRRLVIFRFISLNARYDKQDAFYNLKRLTLTFPCRGLSTISDYFFLTHWACSLTENTMCKIA